MEPILNVEALTKTYGGKGSRTNALRGLSFTVYPGEFVGIMGPSGSGKTTLLNCVSTIDAPTSGRIAVDGVSLTKLRGKALSKFRRERLGFIFQDCNLLDTLTGLENIALALTIGKADPRTVRAAPGRPPGCWEWRRCWTSSPTRCPGGSSSAWRRPGPW